jgi:hypothetical protein
MSWLALSQTPPPPLDRIPRKNQRISLPLSAKITRTPSFMAAMTSESTAALKRNVQRNISRQPAASRLSNPCPAMSSLSSRWNVALFATPAHPVGNAPVPYVVDKKRGVYTAGQIMS